MAKRDRHIHAQQRRENSERICCELLETSLGTVIYTRFTENKDPRVCNYLLIVICYHSAWSKCTQQIVVAFTCWCLDFLPFEKNFIIYVTTTTTTILPPRDFIYIKGLITLTEKNKKKTKINCCLVLYLFKKMERTSLALVSRGTRLKFDSIKVLVDIKLQEEFGLSHEQATARIDWGLKRAMALNISDYMEVGEPVVSAEHFIKETAMLFWEFCREYNTPTLCYRSLQMMLISSLPLPPFSQYLNFTKAHVYLPVRSK